MVEMSIDDGNKIDMERREKASLEGDIEQSAMPISEEEFGKDDHPRTQIQRQISTRSGSLKVRSRPDDQNGGPKIEEDSPKNSNANIVDFEGPDDPHNARNWSRKKKVGMIVALSILTFITPLASSMFAPGIPAVLADFGSNSELLGSFVVSVYILGYAAGPVFLAPTSELYGRRHVYNATNILFVIFTIACAVSSNLNMLVGFRLLQGMAGSGPITLGGGTIADLFVQEQRGAAMAAFAMGPLVGPVVGPIAGGFLVQAKGWRWVFWVIAIAGGAITIAIFLVGQETYPVVILQRKTERLRKVTNNPHLRSRLDRGLSPRDSFRMAIVRPLKMLFLSPIIFLLSTYAAVVYGYIYLLFTTLTLVFQYDYGFSQGIVGLTYLGLGVGMFIGIVTFGSLSDRVLKKKAGTGEMKPEYRLPFMVPGAVVLPIGLFMYGWTAEYRVHWIVPIIGTMLVGMGMIGTFMPMQTYLVDAFTLYAASALAANTIWRSIVGAVLPLAGPAMYERLGLGWGNSVLGFIAIAFLPVPILLTKFGERIRTSARFQLAL